MKKLPILIPVLFIGFLLLTGQDFPDKKWSRDPRMTRLYMTGQYVPLPVDNHYQFSTQARVIHTINGDYIVNPNYLVHPSFNHQSEVPIIRQYNNPNLMLASANIFSGGSTSGGLTVGVYVSTNGGLNWFGSDTLNNGTNNYGDPGPAIDGEGRFYMSYITLSGQIGVSSSTNLGVNWTPQVILTGSSSNSDKNFTTTNDVSSSPYYGRAYTAYTEFSGSLNNRIAFSYTTNSGANWSTVSAGSPPPAAQRFHQGVDLKVGPNGDLYMVWANVNNLTLTEDSLGFSKSTDGGASFVVARGNACNMEGIRNSGSSFMNGVRSNGFPRIDIDKTIGPRRGWIYVVTCEKNVAPATDVADVILNRSTDDGVTWTKKRVNQDTPGNNKYQFMAAVNVDDQGGVNIVYYDSRNTPTNDSCEIYVSRSVDGGETFTDILASDHKLRPKSIPGLAGGYMGDYIGISSANNKLIPYWCDDVVGIYQAWATTIDIPNYPLSSFNLVSPASGTTLTSYPNSSNNYNLRWDTSSSTATYKWVFGNPTTTPRRITMLSGTNSINFTAGQLDVILAGLGVAIGDSLVGQWDVWAFRNNTSNDSLKAANGPRAITLKRGVPPLSAFNLNSPSSGTRIETSVFDFSNITFRWSTSGPGTTYKWKFGSPAISTVRIIRTSNISGIDSSWSIPNYEMDDILRSINVNAGDSIVGQWSVWAYNGFDSVKASQDFAITFKRKGKGDVLVLYDSTSANGRISRDSVTTNLSRLNVTYDTYNRKNQTATDAVSFKGYKRIILLGEGSSVMSNRIKDSLKTYLNSGTTTSKSKLIIMSEDIGYQIDRTASIYFDSAFARSMCGYQFVADRAGVGGRAIIGVTINAGLIDSTYGPSSDVIKRSASVPAAQTFNLYRYRQFLDSMNAIGRIYTNYNVAVMALDAESVRPGGDFPYPFPLKRILDGLIKFVDEIPTGDGETNTSSVPQHYSLSQNYPNPFNPATKISFSLPVKEIVTLKIYDVLGKEVMTLINGEKEAGSYEIEFNASSASGGLSSGIYFYRIKAGNFTETKRMMLLK
ncbi:MAG: hypothetical protein HGGPFJEG_01834 [Ignavibacteria bacterium]|nr:hypothetical protein [Ignavibacteria bacterium]